MYWVHIAGFVVVGLALDWAFFSEMRNQIEMFWPVANGYDYRDLLFPRGWVTLPSSAVVGVGALKDQPHAGLIILGGSLFMLSHLYATYVVWRFGRCR